MKKICGSLLAILLLTFTSEAQTTRYIIKFRDKGTNPYVINDPAAYLSQRAIERRQRYSVAIDSTDLPVTPRYIDSLRSAGAVTVLNASKWLNSVSIQTSDANALAKINTFPFVQSVTGIATRVSGPRTGNKFGTQSIRTKGKTKKLQPLRTEGVTADYFDYGTAYNQVHIHNGEFLHNIGLRGQNMIIGMLDAGFNNYLSVKAFDSVRANGQILGVYDFVAKDSSVNEDNSHGMQCFSTIGANIPGQFVGTAPKANFYLFRSEDAGSEYPIEEHNWVCAAERVDSVGGDLISSSLGYTDFDAPLEGLSHTYADMNGNTTIPAIGADLAAKKGILVVNSAGNEGNNSWKYIVTPADGDSVMAVGAVSATGAVAGFSSFGPSSDGQVKPDVASVGQGTIVQFPNNTIGGSNGTSFSAPNMAGLTTCLWQGFREFNNMKIINALRQAGNNVSTPNDRVGYGIPDVRKATMSLLKEFSTAAASVADCKTTISWTSKDMSAMKYEIERILTGGNGWVKVGERSGTGSLFATHSYQYEDLLTGVLAGAHAYRIRQIIDTAVGHFYADYIDSVAINLTVNCTSTGIDPLNPNVNAITIMPNPTPDKFTLKIATAAAIPNLGLRIFNSKGQEVYSVKQSKGLGTATFTIPVMQLAAGKYYVSVYNEGNLIATKELIKL